MKKSATVILAVLVATGAAVANEPAVAIKEAGVNGGLVVHLGCGDGAVTATLRISGATTVQGLDRDPANVHKARRLIQSKGLYGPVSVDHLRGDVLPYVDNLVRALVVSDAGAIPRDELLRVVCPGCVAIIDGELIVKPWPEEMAQWPQHYNTPDNNAVARDGAVGPPRCFRWIAEPEWQRSHLGLPSMHSLVSAGGQLYSIEDRATAEHPALPGKFALICRDAFNGIELWRHPFANWQPTYMYVKFTPTQLQRQLGPTETKFISRPALMRPSPCSMRRRERSSGDWKAQSGPRNSSLPMASCTPFWAILTTPWEPRKPRAVPRCCLRPAPLPRKVEGVP